MKIKKNDTVMVMTGKGQDKGKTGKVLAADPKNGKVIIEGINVAMKHQKPMKQGDEGGIMKKETPIYACKVMLVCPKCSKPTRVGYSVNAEGKKVRICKKCGAEV